MTIKKSSEQEVGKKKVKVHRVLAIAVVEGLYEIFQNRRTAGKVIQYTLKSNKKWGSRDRSFIAEHIYDIVRWWRLYHHINGTAVSDTYIGTLWRILGIHLRVNEIELPEFDEFAGVSRRMVKEGMDSASSNRAILQSIPDWMDEVCHSELGDRWPKELVAMNQKASVWLRTNTLKTNKQDLLNALQSEGIELSIGEEPEGALYLHRRRNVWQTQAFKKGLFEVQDGGSQMIAPFLLAEPGMRVVDACAGAGGKALHIASILNNKGSVIAMDVEEWKLKELKVRARRNGVHNIDTRHISTTKVVKRLKESADRVLLDVPCSGLGVLKRNPDTKWLLSPEFLDEIKVVQYDILSRYSQMLKPGGKLVYATCSILPSESEDQVQRFLKENDNYVLEEEKRTWPSETNFDGFYMARMHKNG